METIKAMVPKRDLVFQDLATGQRLTVKSGPRFQILPRWIEDSATFKVAEPLGLVVRFPQAEQKADDPAELRRQIAELQTRLAAISKKPAAKEVQ